MARTLTAQGLKASAANATHVTHLGPQAVDRLVEARLDRLPQACQTLARAVAVLGDRTSLTTAASLAGQDITTALQAATALERLEILRVQQQNHQPTLSFVHPLVRAAVYNSVNPAARATAHRRAADLLAIDGANPEQLAAHLLRVHPAGDSRTVAILRTAADQASRHGSPQTAFTYLERALREPPQTGGEEVTLLAQAGAAAQVVDWSKALAYLTRAWETTADPEAKAAIAEMLGRALFILGRNSEAVLIYKQAIRSIADDALRLDLRQRLQAGLINVTIADAELRESADPLVAQLREEVTTDQVGGRSLDALVGWCLAITATVPEPAVGRSRRALAKGVLIDQANGSEAFADACWVLVAADLEEVLPVLDAALADAHRRGMAFATGVGASFRALTWFRHGALAEAQRDAKLAMQLSETARIDVLSPLAASFLADTLIEQGRPEQARQALDSAQRADLPPTAAQWYWSQASHGRLLLQSGQTDEGLTLLLECGQRFQEHGWNNPAFLSWRPDAVLALHALDRTDEARALAQEELRLARQWGAPWALGRTLRVTGLVASGSEGLRLLRESVNVLKDSPAKLEYAKALAALGAALRRAGHRTDARSPLRLALDLATRCGAAPLAEHTRTELAAAGGRPRRTEVVGPESLTPSERRIAELAAAGATNRQIAQELYVTPKTVEVHLSAVYRKLGITSRTRLDQALSQKPLGAVRFEGRG